MCCGSESHHSGSYACGGHADIGMCFWSKKEKIGRLEEYQEDLQAESKFFQRAYHRAERGGIRIPQRREMVLGSFPFENLRIEDA